jgi:hypothetical protein
VAQAVKRALLTRSYIFKNLSFIHF